MVTKKSKARPYFKEIPNFLTFFIVTMYIFSLSPILIEISASTGISIRDLNLIFTFILIGNISGNLTSGFLNKRFESIKIIVFSYACIFVTTIIAMLFYSKYVFYTSYLVVGFFLGTIFVQASSIVLSSTIKNRQRLISLAFSFIPFGALAGPFFAVLIINMGLDWKYIYSMYLFIMLFNIVLYILLGRRTKKIPIPEQKSLSLKKFFQDRQKRSILIFASAIMFFYGASQVVLTTFSPTFFRSMRGFDLNIAGLIVMIYWASKFAGRITFGSFIGRQSKNNILLACSLISFMSVNILVFSKSVISILISSSIAGFAISVLQPILISKGDILQKSEKSIYVSAISAFGGLGAASSPFFTNFFLDNNMLMSFSFSSIFTALAVLFIAASIFHEKSLTKK